MKKMCLILTCVALVAMPILSASAKVTFHAALESKEQVEATGGSVVGGGSFVPGVIGNGFISDETEAVVHYPFEGHIPGYQEQGTLECWLVLGWDLDKFSDVTDRGEAFMFWSYNKAGTDAIGLMVGGGHNTPIAWFRVREVDEEWHSAASEELDWKEGEAHHMLGTWGPNAVNLYLDGEWAADDPYVGGPKNPIERLSINNNESDPANFATYSIVDELRIHDVQLDDDEVAALYEQRVAEAATSVDPTAKLATTWAAVKRQ